MQNIKNFKFVEPTQKQIKKYKLADGRMPIFLLSEDGKDWYECHSLFADDTVKIMYDSRGIILSVVDKPVPHRGNIYAVSMFNPVNMSVAEVSQDSYPDGVTIDGSWMFNGKDVVPYQLSQSELIARAKLTKTELLDEARGIISTLQYAVDSNMATDEEVNHLAAWKEYSVMLYRVDISLTPDIDWPVVPSL